MYRPTLESLEKRQLCAVDVLSTVASEPAGILPMEECSLNILPACDGSGKDVAYLTRMAAPQIASDGLCVEGAKRSSVLPYVEQDNLFKQYSSAQSTQYDAAHDEVFSLIGRVGDASPYLYEPQGIIAILIGLAAEPTDAGLPLNSRS